ncbi:MAG: peptidyl-prolyl cis-trans isomerase, partial [Bacteroidota bacterium]
LLSRSSLLQTSNEKYNYYFKIHEYKRANEVSPLELVSDQIADIIVYKRKIDLANKIKEEILQKAQKNNDCIIYEY